MIKNGIIQKAMRVSRDSPVLRGKVGAVLFTDTGHIIASAYNTTWFGLLDNGIRTIHAEKFLLDKAFRLKAFERFGRLNILVVRTRSDGSLANATPCKVCRSYLKSVNARIYYTDKLGTIRKL